MPDKMKQFHVIQYDKKIFKICKGNFLSLSCVLRLPKKDLNSSNTMV